MQPQTEQLWLDRWEIAKREPWYFIRYFVNTFDEHEFTDLAFSKPFPNKAVYRIIVRAWKEIDVLHIEKSRQIMMTWLMCALYLWLVMFFPVKRVVLQSKKEDDANAILDRARHIYELLQSMNLPGLPEAKVFSGKIGTNTNISFPKIKGEISSIPQGPDIIRSRTYSGILADEMNHQPQYRDGHAAAMPAISNGARYTGQGTANGHTAGYEILHGIDDRTGESIGAHILDSDDIKEKKFIPPSDLDEEGKRRWVEAKIMNLSDDEFNAMSIAELCAEMPGMRYWITADDGHSLSVHYSSDADKSPKTAVGRKWIVESKKRMKSPTRWAREMEINYDTYEGRPVISNWDYDLFVRELHYDSCLKLLFGIDFGTVLCGCPIAQYVPIQWEGQTFYQLRILAEIIMRRSNTPDLATEIIKVMERDFSGAWNKNNFKAYCDPAGNQERETTNDKSQATSIGILQSRGIYPISKKFGVPETTELLETVFALILPNGEPAVLIDPSCEYMIKCYEGGLHYPKNGRPGYYEKDDKFDHGGDMSRYLFANCFDKYALSGAEKKQLPPPNEIRRRFTGEIIGRRRSTRINPRRGEHSVRS